MPNPNHDERGRFSEGGAAKGGGESKHAPLEHVRASDARGKDPATTGHAPGSYKQSVTDPAGYTRDILKMQIAKTQQSIDSYKHTIMTADRPSNVMAAKAALKVLRSEQMSLEKELAKATGGAGKRAPKSSTFKKLVESSKPLQPRIGRREKGPQRYR